MFLSWLCWCQLQPAVREHTGERSRLQWRQGMITHAGKCNCSNQGCPATKTATEGLVRHSRACPAYNREALPCRTLSLRRESVIVHETCDTSVVPPASSWSLGDGKRHHRSPATPGVSPGEMPCFAHRESLARQLPGFSLRIRSHLQGWKPDRPGVAGRKAAWNHQSPKLSLGPVITRSKQSLVATSRCSLRIHGNFRGRA